MKKTLLLPVIALAMSAFIGCAPKTPSFTDDDYGYMLLNDLVGLDGTLSINKDYASITKDNVEKKYYPTEIKTEEFVVDRVYDAEGELILEQKQNYIVLYYGSSRNDANYRIVFSAAKMKRVELQKKGADSWELVSTFIPQAPEYAGAYNGVGYNHDANYVYIIGNELRDDLSNKYMGYEIANYYARGGNLGRDNFMLVPGFYMVQSKFGTNVYKCADMLDLEDGEFFEANWYVKPNNPDLYYITSRGISSSATMYADPTMFLSEIVDEDGNRMKNSYTLNDDYSVKNYKIDGKNAEYTASRGEDGVKFKFVSNKVNNGNDEAVVNNVTILPGKYEFTTNNGASKKFASLTTWFDESALPCEELEQEPRKYIAGDWSYSFEMSYLNFDWDTDDPIDLTYRWNGQNISGANLHADKEGRAVLSFKSNDKDVSIRKGNENIAIVETDNKTSFGFRYDELVRLFNDDFVNPAQKLVISIDKDLNVSVNSSEPSKPTFEYFTNVGIVLVHNDRLLVPYASTYNETYSRTDFFGYVYSGKNEEGIAVVRKDELSKYEGHFLSDKTHTLAFKNGDFKINDASIEYDLTFLVNQSNGDYALAFVFTMNNQEYYALPAVKSFTIYNSNFNRVAYYLDSDIFNSLTGNYVYYGDFGKEYIRFHDDGSLTMDALNAAGDGLVRDVLATYSVSASESGISITAAITLPSGQSGAVPMNKDEGAVVIGGTLAYLEESLYDLQGIYGDGNENAIMFYQNAIFINTPEQNGGFSTRQSIKSISTVEDNGNKKYTIETTYQKPDHKDDKNRWVYVEVNYVIEATFNGETLTSLSFYDKEVGENGRVNLDVTNNHRNYFEQTYKYINVSTSENYSAKLTNSVKDGKINIDVTYRTGGFPEAGTTINGVTIHNGHVAIKINHALTALYLYMNGTTPVMEK